MHIPDSITDRMTAQIDQWEQCGDQRAVFLACYLRMTRNMLAGAQAGRFHDPPWVTRFVHDFAAYYFRALDAYEAGSLTVPPIWREAHELAAEPTTPVVKNLMLGVNAHINYDLVLVLDDLLRPTWRHLNPAERQACYADYCTVNTIIAETIDCVQNDVVQPYARLMQIVDVSCGPLDEWLTARLLRAWRADVWDQALALVIAPDKVARLELREQTARLAHARVRLLIHGGDIGARTFGYPLRWLRRLKLL
jgi:hypothetical protein